MAEVRVLAHGQVKSIDVGQANNEHYFEAAGVGIDAALFPWVKKSKVGAGVVCSRLLNLQWLAAKAKYPA